MSFFCLTSLRNSDGGVRNNRFNIIRVICARYKELIIVKKSGLIIYLYYVTFVFNFGCFVSFNSQIKMFVILTFLRFCLLI